MTGKNIRRKISEKSRRIKEGKGRTDSSKAGNRGQNHNGIGKKGISMTLQELYQEGILRLEQAKIMEAELDAWYLMEYVTGISRTMYYLKQQETVEKETVVRYFACISRRAKRIPLQHITGEQEFMGLTFFVNEHVLIPRQDTEVLVEEALLHLNGEEQVLDMCTGSGCILLSLVHYRKGICAVGADISDEALQIAERNAKRLEERVTFLKSDLFDRIAGKYDLIVSNPPYIRTEVIAELEEEVRLHDPMIALDGKEDGLYFYRKITEQSRKHLSCGGWLLFEIGHDQGEDVARIMEDAGFAKVSVKKDLAGLDRVVSGMYNR